MTMCVFWKDKDNNIHIATDSRLNNDSSALDHCLKISRLNCEIHECNDISGGDKVFIKNIKLAISFCGGFVSAYTIKESLTEILNKMVLVPDSSNISMDLITDVALTVYEKVIRDAVQYFIGKVGACNFYIAGFCPISNEVEMYKLGVREHDSQTGFDCFKEKCFQNTDYIIDGSGAGFLKQTDSLDNHYLKAYRINNQKPLLDLLLSVIEDEGCASVGGAIQYAKCEHDNIIIHAMYDHKNGAVRYMRGGVDINELIGDYAARGVVFETNMIGKLR
ncbi:hypothetical protein B8O08_22395 [Klebsiella variicola]|uniref:hypothetical protein n=1 Tax=Klebsiella variicola TaxID=244366 RepID=UPI000A3D863E|nr:hypothetical protein [Klebsiella variicola]ART07450.1 hypothetical protein B8O08_22395 [Klebsiella variicola]